MLTYNGIIIDANNWPPKYPTPKTLLDMSVPYLERPMQCVNIDVGRQLFVDEFLIARSDANREHHTATYHHNNPILQADRSWELTKEGYAYAAPFSDGVWFDEEARLFRMWYLAGGGEVNLQRHAMCTCYAESEDGVHWRKPILDVVPGTNIVDISNRDSCTVWLDKEDADKSKRFKMFLVRYEDDHIQWQYILKYSEDGIHWREGVAQSGAIADRSTAFFNPFRQKWCLSMRHHVEGVSWRSRSYLEHDEAEEAVSLAHRLRADVDDKHIRFWFTPDTQEQQRNDYLTEEPGIYNFDAIAYESLIIGFYSQWQGPENHVCKAIGIPKRNEVQLGYSRDGFHFLRPVHKAFALLGTDTSAWNYGNMQSINGTPVIVGDYLYFYFSGRQKNDAWWDAGMSTGLAYLRRDGFASMYAKDLCYIETVPLEFTGTYLFVNAKLEEGGSLDVAVKHQDGSVVSGYTYEKCISFRGDSTKVQVQWEGIQTMPAASSPLCLSFRINHGRIYAFWISESENGESAGYTAGGGPGLSSAGRDIPISPVDCV